MVLSASAVAAASAGPPGGAARWAALCFAHIGPEDKPMPAFCVHDPAQPGGPDEPVQATVLLSPQGWQDLLAALGEAGAPDDSRPAVFGRYRVQSRPVGLDQALAPQFMRRLVAIVRRDARRQGQPVPALVEQLARRLAR